MSNTKYVVLNENTLCYRIDGQDYHLGVLAGSVIRGGHDWKNGPVAVGPLDTLRPATAEDFEFFRVDPKGHLPPKEPAQE